jgi:hypothetical protein
MRAPFWLDSRSQNAGAPFVKEGKSAESLQGFYILTL